MHQRLKESSVNFFVQLLHPLQTCTDLLCAQQRADARTGEVHHYFRHRDRQSCEIRRNSRKGLRQALQRRSSGRQRIPSRQPASFRETRSVRRQHVRQRRASRKRGEVLWRHESTQRLSEQQVSRREAAIVLNGSTGFCFSHRSLTSGIPDPNSNTTFDARAAMKSVRWVSIPVRKMQCFIELCFANPFFRYGVFGLGSTLYPHFCAFGHILDDLMADLGAKRCVPCGEGDEMRGQEDSFHKWCHSAFKVLLQSHVILLSLGPAIEQTEHRKTKFKMKVTAIVFLL